MVVVDDESIGSVVDHRSALLQIYRAADALRPEEILQRLSDALAAGTASQVGFVHFVSADQAELAVGAWSAGTLLRCPDIDIHSFRLREVLDWALPAYTAQTWVDNETGGHHSECRCSACRLRVRRHLVVPVVRHGSVRMVVGVGGRAVAYDARDRLVVEEIASHAWDLWRGARRRRHRRRQQRWSDVVAEGLQAAGWSCDLASGVMDWDDHVTGILGEGALTVLGHSLAGFLSLVDDSDRQTVEETLKALSPGESFAHTIGARSVDGRLLVIRWVGSTAHHQDGRGVIARGYVQQLANVDPNRPVCVVR